MKIVPMTVDFSRDIYTMCEYLIKVDAYPNCPEVKIGRFMLGRATGHTTAVIAAAERLRSEGKVVHLVLHTSTLTRELRHHADNFSLNSYSVDVMHGCRESCVPDIIIFDTWTCMQRGNHRKADEIETHMLPALHSHFKKKTAMLFVQ
ncbi:hypothetical protein NVP1081O_100 [Vibrio phage 1.081.O._10N.286.52.C2]|nr:hypothetical protein NVP1081O_100 [Vibrio phage 1.081.O._10N.286.52.C2]